MDYLKEPSKIILSKTKYQLAKTAVQSLSEVSCSGLHVSFYLN